MAAACGCLGRELDLPETAATVRVRGGETLVTDGPFAENEEFIAVFDILDSADLDEAIEVVAECPASGSSARDRAVHGGAAAGRGASAFARGEDGAAGRHLLTMWLGGTPAASFDDQAVMDEGEAWRQDLEARGLQVLGNALEGTDTATTVRVRGGETLLSVGPFIETRSSSPALTSSAAPTGSRPSSRGRAPDRRYHAPRCARSTANNHAHCSPVAVSQDRVRKTGATVCWCGAGQRTPVR